MNQQVNRCCRPVVAWCCPAVQTARDMEQQTVDLPMPEAMHMESHTVDMPTPMNTVKRRTRPAPVWVPPLDW